MKCVACDENEEVRDGLCAKCVWEAGEDPGPPCGDGLPEPAWHGRGVTLYHGDGAELGTLFVERGMVFMDPPYSAHVHKKSRSGAGASVSKETDLGFTALTSALRRRLARAASGLASRWVAVLCDERGDWKWRLSLEAAGLEYVRTAWWRKEGGTPQFTGDRPAVPGELILLAHPPGKKRWNGGGKHGFYSIPTALGRGGSGEKRINNTQKPILLIEAVLRDFAEPGDIVYDLTAGGGTTGIACMRLGLRCVLVETREDQVKATVARLAKEAAKPIQLEMFGRRPAAMKQVSLL